MTTDTPVQMLAYRFPAGANYQGELVGAIERLEVGEAIAVRNVIFVRKDPDTSELVALEAAGSEAVGKAIEFRLDGMQGLAGDAGTDHGLSRADIDEVGSALEPGEAAGFLVIEHTWLTTLDRAAAQLGGARVSGGVVA